MSWGIACGACKRAAPKKIPETDAIFDRLAQVHKEAQEDESILRVSMDAKAQVLVGLFSRNGQTRMIVNALDHDFKPDEKVTPYGIFLPQYNEIHLYFATGPITSDFIVDCLTDCWQSVQARFPHVKTLLINQDNGPENASRRTQFMKRMAEFADIFQLTIDLAYYPPYHSKYNPIERVWGVLENHWNGSLLDTVDTVLRFAASMTWKGQHPAAIKLVKKTYSKGISLTKKAMATLEERLERLPGLENWFVRISPVSL